MILQDINPQGDVLITRTNPRIAMFWGNLDNGSAEDISLLDWSRAVAITRDGRLLLFDESGEGGGKQYSVYLYNSLSKTSERLGEGRAIDMSPDGRWVLTQAAGDPSHLTLTAVSPRKSSPVSTSGLTYQWGKFIPDSDCPEILFAASQTGYSVQLYRQSLPSGKPQVVAREMAFSNPIINDEGDLVAGLDADARLSILDLRTGTLRSNGIARPSVPVKFMDRTRILTSRYDNGTISLNMLDTTSGEERLYRRFPITDNTGTAHIFPLRMTRDLKRFAYSQLQPLSDLFVVSGWS
jgi:Tol biopolymer transport system component